MSNADKLFKELGYKKLETDFYINYSKEYETHTAYIEFNNAQKLICTLVKLNEPKAKNVWQSFNAQKIKAIYLKCEELRLV